MDACREHACFSRGIIAERAGHDFYLGIPFPKKPGGHDAI
jgi:hypothetical protein